MQIIDTHNLTSSTIKASYWKLISVIALASSNLLTLAILSRLLLPNQFGLVAAAQIITGFIAMFSDVGVSSAIVQKRDLSTNHISVGFTTSICLGLAVGATIWFGAPLFSQVLNIDISTGLIRCLSLAFPISSISSVAEALLIRKLDFKKLFFADLFSRIFAYTIVSIFLAIKGFGEWSLVGGTIISTFIRSIYLLYSAKTRLKFIIRKREFLELFSFGGMYSLLRVINYFAQKADNFVVGRYLGVDTLGLYDRAFQIMSYPGMLIGNVLDGTMFPSMSIVQNQPERLKNAYYRSLSLVNIILMPLSIFLVLNAPEIIKILLGKPWMGLVNPLQVLFLVIPLRSSSRMCDSLARAKGALSQNALQKLIYLFVITLGSFFGKRYGLVGVAWGVNFAVIVHFLLMSYLGETLIGGKAIKILVTFKEGLHYSLIVFVVCGFSLLMLRMFIEYAIITLIIEMIVLMVVFWVICQVFPRFFGDDLRWFIRNLIFAVPNTKVRLRLMNFSRMEIE